jgi:hypothetical protein
MPGLVEEDFEEAAAILNKFPRGATALIHVCIEKLMPAKQVWQRREHFFVGTQRSGSGNTPDDGGSSGTSKKPSAANTIQFARRQGNGTQAL